MIKDKMTAVVMWCVLTAFVNHSAIVRAQDFSADLVATKDSSHPDVQRGRVFVAGDVARIEVPGFDDGFFIADAGRPRAWFVRPRQALFMDAKQSSPLTQVLVRVDAEAARRTWQSMEEIASVETASGDTDDRADAWRCDLLGHEMVDGRDTVRYVVRSRHSGRSYRWIDPQHEFPIKVEAEDGTMVTLENLADAPQLASMFAVPAGFRRFDPRQLLDQIKQSDVWVAPPPQ